MIDRTDRDRYPHQIQLHPIHPYSAVAGDHHNQYSAGGKSGYSQQEGPSVTRILTVLSLVPVGGSLLVLAGLTLTGVLIGLAITTPLFIIFSPVLIPAAITVSLAITAFLASGAFGLTGLSSLSWVFNYFRRATGSVPEQLEYYAKRHMLDVTAYAGQKTKDVGQEIQNKALEAKRT